MDYFFILESVIIAGNLSFGGNINENFTGDDVCLFQFCWQILSCGIIRNSAVFSECFCSGLSAAAGPYRIEWRSVNHRILGTNEIPAAIWIDRLSDALGLLGKRRAADQFAALIELTRDKQPELIPWLTRRPLRALELAEDWPRLLEIVALLLKHPRPAIYLRQIDLPGVHTKLIEGHRGVLAALLDLVMPEDSIDGTHTGIGGFCRRYGFLDKPSRVRFRLLGVCRTFRRNMV